MIGTWFPKSRSSWSWRLCPPDCFWKTCGPVLTYSVVCAGPHGMVAIAPMWTSSLQDFLWSFLRLHQQLLCLPPSLTSGRWDILAQILRFFFPSGFILCIVSVECRLQGLGIRQPALSSLVQLLHCVLLSFIQRLLRFHLCGLATRKRKRRNCCS